MDVAPASERLDPDEPARAAAGSLAVEAEAWLDGEVDEHVALVASARDANRDAILHAAEIIRRSLHDGGTVLVAGNGGSAASAEHLSAELLGRFGRHRDALRCLSLVGDAAALTSLSNDFGFESVFARQVGALARRGDVLVAISTSGDSPNIVEAARTAREVGCDVVALTGRDGGGVGDFATALIAVPSRSVQRVQEVHVLVLHLIVGLVRGADATLSEPSGH